VHAHLDDVVAGLCLHLGGVLRGLLGSRDMVDANPDAGVLGEALADLRQLLVRGGSEIVPAEVGNLALLTQRGRDAGRENADETAGPGQEAAAAVLIHGLLRPVVGFLRESGRTPRRAPSRLPDRR
jgi:hypothetical protein